MIALYDKSIRSRADKFLKMCFWNTDLFAFKRYGAIAINDADLAGRNWLSGIPTGHVNSIIR
jgi:hypothetical protein